MKRIILSLLLLCSIATSAFAIDPFATGVVGRWKLSENAGNTAGWVDLSSNSNDLTGVGTPTAGSGHTAGSGDAVQLTAASAQKLNITSAAATGLHDFASAFTFSAWINPDTTPGTDMSILGTWTDASSKTYILIVDGSANTPRLFVSNNGSSLTNINGSTAVTIGTWMHVLVSWTGTQLELYVDNVSDATPVNFSAGLANFANDWCIGAQNNCTDRYFDGRIDDVTIWDRALTADERTYVFQLRGEFGSGSAGVNSVAGKSIDKITSLSGATATGVGATNLLAGARCTHSWTTALTGAPTGVTLLLEGSLDEGATFFALDTSTATTDGIRHVVDKCVDVIRSNLTVLSGGTAPTVTTIIESAQ